MKKIKIKWTLKAFQDKCKTQKYFPQNKSRKLYIWPYPTGIVCIISPQKVKNQSPQVLKKTVNIHPIPEIKLFFTTLLHLIKKKKKIQKQKTENLNFFNSHKNSHPHAPKHARLQITQKNQLGKKHNNPFLDSIWFITKDL